MRLKLMIVGAFIGTFGLAALALPTGSGGGGGAGSGGGGGSHGGGAAQASTGHASARLGSRIPSTGFGTREESELAKIGFVGVHEETIDGHNATVVVFKGHALTVSERELIYRYHFKGFNECTRRGTCAEPRAPEMYEMYCRRARNAAITRDLECLSFRPSE